MLIFSKWFRMLSCQVMKPGKVSGEKKYILQNENKIYSKCFQNQNKGEKSKNSVSTGIYQQKHLRSM